MTTQAAHDLARRYFAALSAGNVPDDLLTEDMTAWTTSSGHNPDKARYQGAIRLLKTLFDGGLTYTVDSLTAEDDRIAAEVRSHGTFKDGEGYESQVLFMIRIRDGRIASVAEHFDPRVVLEKLGPRMAAAMAARA